MAVKIRNFVRLFFLQIYYLLLTKIYGMNISKSARISLGAKLDKTYPIGINIGDESYIASGAILFSHDFTRHIHCQTFIGKRCFIGANSIIMPGVVIGDSVIVGAGAVVTKDVESNCIVAGNPAVVIKKDISTNKYGSLKFE